MKKHILTKKKANVLMPTNFNNINLATDIENLKLLWVYQAMKLKKGLNLKKKWESIHSHMIIVPHFSYNE